MAKKQTPPIVISLHPLSKSEKKKVVKDLSRDVTKSRKYRKALRSTDTPIPKHVAKAAAQAAVVATLNRAEPEPARRTALDVYTDLVATFSGARRRYKVKQKKHAKTAKKNGYNEKTGLYTLRRAPKVKLAKKAKPYKAKKPKKKVR